MKYNLTVFALSNAAAAIRYVSVFILSGISGLYIKSVNIKINIKKCR